MISPFKSRRGGGGEPQSQPGTPRSPRTAIPLRGLLLDGVWRCNCPERPPAVRLQTRNHGVNHGRWFYTCQKDHKNRCKFFLWSSDAEAREKLALLSNSRTEAPQSGSSSPTPNTQTPSSKTVSAQSTAGTGLLTPQTGHRGGYGYGKDKTNQITTPASAKARMMTEDTDEFDWDDSMEDEMEKVFESSQPMRQPEFGLPRKGNAEEGTGPGKRKRADEDEDGERNAMSTPGGSGAGRQGQAAKTSFLTPTPKRYKDASVAVAESPLASSSDLAAQVSRILESHGVAVPAAAREELGDLFNRHEMKTKGIVRGRDISRVSLRKKDEQIARLNERIAMLESQRELKKTLQ